MIKKLLIVIVVLGIGAGTYYILQNKQNNNINAENINTKNINSNNNTSKYSNCELGDLVGDDVERIVYKNFYIDYFAGDFTKIQVESIAQECIDEGVQDQNQIDCCVRMKMYSEG